MYSVSAAHPARPSVTAFDAPPTPVCECILRSKFPAKAVGRILLKIKAEYRFSSLRGVADLTNLPVHPSRFDIARGVQGQPGRLMIISRRAAILSSSGGWVLNKDAQTEPPPNIGFTMHRAAVVSGMLLGMR